MPRPIIFDFDGVIADSEVLSNRALARSLTAFGFPTTPEQSVELYTGLRMTDCVAAIEKVHGKKVPEEFVASYRAAVSERMRRELKEVPGAARFIGTLTDRTIAIASSSGMARLELCLGVLRLADRFEGSVFSAADIERGKPHPDIYLHAARSKGVPPADCIVIEDGTLGVRAAVAAGMTPIGLTAGSHCGANYAAELRIAGAGVVASNYEEVAEIVRGLDGQRGGSRG